MKLRNKLIAITVIAMLAFIGIGFAAWTFTGVQEVEVAAGNIQDKVAVGIELNDGFKLYNADDDTEVTALYLICDAPTVGVAGKYLAGQGVYWATDAAGANAITDVYIKGTLAKADEDAVLDKATVDVAFTATKSITSTYIQFGAFSAIANTTGIAVANNAVVQSADFALPAVSYVSAMIPESIAELTTMNTTLATELSTATLSFTAQIVG